LSFRRVPQPAGGNGSRSAVSPPNEEEVAAVMAGAADIAVFRRLRRVGDDRVAQPAEQLLAVHHRIIRFEGYLAATAKVHGLTLVTRSTRDLQRTGVTVLDPWAGG